MGKQKNTPWVSVEKIQKLGTTGERKQRVKVRISIEKGEETVEKKKREPGKETETRQKRQFRYVGK